MIHAIQVVLRRGDSRTAILPASLPLFEVTARLLRNRRHPLRRGRAWVPMGTRAWVRFFDLPPVLQQQIHAHLPGLIVVERDVKVDTPVRVANRCALGNVHDLIGDSAVKVLVVVGGAQLVLVFAPDSLGLAAFHDIVRFHLEYTCRHLGQCQSGFLLTGW